MAEQDADRSQIISEMTAPRTRRAVIGSAALIGVSLPAVASGISPGQRSSGLGFNVQDADPADLAKRLRKRQFSDDMVAAAVEALASVGVGTYEAPDAAEPLLPVIGPPSPLRYLEWQVVSMTHELATRNGMTGAELDGLLEPVEGAPTPALLLAAYAQETATPGGDLVRRVLGRRNWKNYPAIMFPGLVQAIFVGELTQMAAAANASATVNRRAFLRSPVTHHQPGSELAYANGVCSAISGWVDSILTAVADALKVDTSEGGVLGFLGSIWNAVVDLGKGLIIGLIETLTAPIVGIIKSIATVIAVISQVISLIKPWNITFEADPAENRFGVGAETMTGKVSARVDTGFDGDWPPTLKDCAAEAGVALPSLTGANSPVEWSTAESPIDLMSVTDQDNAVGGDGQATIAYTTNNEDEETAKGEPQDGTVDLKVSIKRDDLKLLKQTISGLLFAALPAFVANVLQPILGPTVASLLDKIVALEPAKATGNLTIVYHEKKDPTPTNTPEEGNCPYGTWSVSNLAGVAQSIIENLGGDAGIQIVYSDDSGSSTVDFQKDGTFTWSWDAYQVSGTTDIPGTGILLVVMILNGTASGTFSLESGSLTLTEVSGTFGVSGESFINGTSLGPIDIPPEAWLSAGGSLAIACGDGGDHMTLFPLWINVDEGYELSRI